MDKRNKAQKNVVLAAQSAGPNVSLIIPLLNDDAALSVLLDALKGFDLFEVLIVDSTLRATPPSHMAQDTDLPIKWLRSPKGRGRQIQTGLDHAKGEYSWILHADCLPHPESISEIRRILSRPKNVMGSFSLRFTQSRQKNTLSKRDRIFLACFSKIAHFETRFTTFGDQGFFFRRSDYHRLQHKAGLDLKLYPIMEDVAMRQAFKALGCIRKSALEISTSARRFEKYGIWRTQFRNTVFIMRYLMGQSLPNIYTQYYAYSAKAAPLPITPHSRPTTP